VGCQQITGGSESFTGADDNYSYTVTANGWTNNGFNYYGAQAGIYGDAYSTIKGTGNAFWNNIAFVDNVFYGTFARVNLEYAMSSGQVMRDMPYIPYAVPRNQVEANAEFSTNFGLMFFTAPRVPKVPTYEGFAVQAARSSVAIIEDVAIETKAVHGNSLSSTKPTWGYELFQADDTFLKNGITSEVKPENRYTKSFMEGKYIKKVELFPNRRAAYNWEYNQNMIHSGPLNKERYLIKTQ
jgi:hypothetical protein